MGSACHARESEGPGSDRWTPGGLESSATLGPQVIPSTGGGGYLAKKEKHNPREGGWKQFLQVRWKEAQQSCKKKEERGKVR